ncbi:Oidioi.mRNA.OKI2018_I69.chr2.g8290.t1.cds [Oikopleura dioica]|uniref:Oidioi.mRNA.OKI2018_I69.chr2.g8290.t1.cds n=1 Tax=Oikopleura dioica TaxID=34765 RepID=A0ABN7TC36_OIKDI|nr:Oidioi.mRNA.OKI2018_I69.chr2.g8290.t1.cds [Oikopleura dioica]
MPLSRLDGVEKRVGFKCTVDECGKVFQEREDILKHIKENHKTGRFKKVLLGSTAKPPTAGAITAKKTAGLASITLHRKKETKEKEEKQKVYRCTVCRLIKPTRNEIEAHCLAKHNQKSKWILVNRKKQMARKAVDSLKSLKDEYDNVETYHCPYCEFETEKLTGLVKHLPQHTPDDLYEVSLRLQKNMKLKTFRCIVCFYRSLKGSTLREHLESHSEEDILDRALDFSNDQADDSSSEEEEDEETEPEIEEENIIDFKQPLQFKPGDAHYQAIQDNDIVLPKKFTCTLCSYLCSSKKEVSMHVKDFHRIEMNEHLILSSFIDEKLESLTTDTPDKKARETITLPAAKKLTTKPHQGRKESTICLGLNIFDNC